MVSTGGLRQGKAGRLFAEKKLPNASRFASRDVTLAGGCMLEISMH